MTESATKNAERPAGGQWVYLRAHESLSFKEVAVLRHLQKQKRKNKKSLRIHLPLRTRHENGMFAIFCKELRKRNKIIFKLCTDVDQVL